MEIRLPREDHPISRKSISNAALKVLYGLRDAGYEALLVGGAVRDVLSGIEPKDFDIATNAKPEEIRRVFRTARLIGRRFVIAHVRFGSEIIEVTTFRGEINDQHKRDETGRILVDNHYGDLESDAFRRDFTANAVYYDINDFGLIDYTGGIADIQNRVLRLIGDPELRYREDPVRMLRAVRIANKLGFAMEFATEEAIPRLAHHLREIPAARLFDEIIKILMTKEAVSNFKDLRQRGLFAELFPGTEATLQRHPGMEAFILKALGNTAARIANNQAITPAFLYAALLWPSVAERVVSLIGRQGYNPAMAISQAGDEAIAKACVRVTIPKRFSLVMQEIWDSQPRFEHIRGPRVQRFMSHPRFRASYDFLLLRAETGDADPQLAQWWTQAQVGVDLHALRADAVDDANEAIEQGSDAPAETSGAIPAKKRRRRRKFGSAGNA